MPEERIPDWLTSLPNWPELGGYRLGDLLAAGGQGLVFAARELQSQEDCALKLPRALDDSPVFERAATIYDDDWDPRYFVPGKRINLIHEAFKVPAVSMELCETDLSRYLKRPEAASPHLSPAEFASLVRSMLSALEDLHERGYVYRDLKPANVAVDSQRAPRFRLLDLMAAASSDSSVQLNRDAKSRHFSHPARLNSKAPATPATDIYECGACLLAAVGWDPKEETADKSRAAVMKALRSDPDWEPFVDDADAGIRYMLDPAESSASIRGARGEFNHFLGRMKERGNGKHSTLLMVPALLGAIALLAALAWSGGMFSATTEDRRTDPLPAPDRIQVVVVDEEGGTRSLKVIGRDQPGRLQIRGPESRTVIVADAATRRLTLPPTLWEGAYDVIGPDWKASLNVEARLDRLDVSGLPVEQGKRPRVPIGQTVSIAVTGANLSRTTRLQAGDQQLSQLSNPDLGVAPSPERLSYLWTPRSPVGPVTITAITGERVIGSLEVETVSQALEDLLALGRDQTYAVAVPGSGPVWARPDIPTIWPGKLHAAELNAGTIREQGLALETDAAGGVVNNLHLIEANVARYYLWQMKTSRDPLPHYKGLAEWLARCISAEEAVTQVLAPDAFLIPQARNRIRELQAAMEFYQRLVEAKDFPCVPYATELESTNEKLLANDDVRTALGLEADEDGTAALQNAIANDQIKFSLLLEVKDVSGNTIGCSVDGEHMDQLEIPCESALEDGRVVLTINVPDGLVAAEWKPGAQIYLAFFMRYSVPKSEYLPSWVPSSVREGTATLESFHWRAATLSPPGYTYRILFSPTWSKIFEPVHDKSLDAAIWRYAPPVEAETIFKDPKGE